MALRLGTQALLQRTTDLPSATAATICGWFRKRGAGGSAAQVLVAFATTDGTAGVGVYIDLGGTSQFYVGSGGAPVSSGVTVTTDQWYFVALSNAGTGATDAKVRHAAPGATSLTTASTTGVSFTPGQISLGSEHAAYWANVALAGWKAYNRVLTDTELLAEMNRLAPASTTSLNFWTPMVHDVVATSYKDYSGNGRDLSSGGTITFEDGPPVGWGAPTLVVGPVVASDVTAALTGSSSTASAGTAGVTHTQAASGSAVTASAGTLTALAEYSAALTGTAATASAGTVSPVNAAALSGSGVTVSAGTVASERTVAASGSGVVTVAGTVTAVSATSAALTGAEAAASAGSVALAHTVALPGSAAAVTAGALVAEASQAIVGSDAATSAGAVAVTVALALAGSEATAAAGSVTPSLGGTVGLSGSVATATAGALGVQVSSAISGSVVSVDAGTISASVDAIGSTAVNLHPLNRARSRYAVRLGGEMVFVDSPQALQAAIDDFEQQTQERARRKGEAVAKTAPRTTPKAAARAAPRVSVVEAPEVDREALAAQMAATNARIRETYENATRAALIARYLEIEMQVQDDEAAIMALEA